MAELTNSPLKIRAINATIFWAVANEFRCSAKAVSGDAPRIRSVEMEGHLAAVYLVKTINDLTDETTGGLFNYARETVQKKRAALTSDTELLERTLKVGKVVRTMLGLGNSAEETYGLAAAAATADTNGGQPAAASSLALRGEEPIRSSRSKLDGIKYQVLRDNRTMDVTERNELMVAVAYKLGHDPKEMGERFQLDKVGVIFNEFHRKLRLNPNLKIPYEAYVEKMRRSGYSQQQTATVRQASIPVP